MDLSVLLKKALALPKKPGVYLMRNAEGVIIYVGKAKILCNRVSSYFRERALYDKRVSRMIVYVQDFDVIVTDTELEALVLECSLIKRHMPKYNILLKDDKGFSYIRVGTGAYPRLSAVFRPENDGARYIGPYMSGYAVKQMIETANAAFSLPTCNKAFPDSFGKSRPCLNSHIGLCMAVCTGKIPSDEYLQYVDSAVELITKGSDTMLTLLNDRMNAASEAMEYERAAKYRDSIVAIRKSTAKQKIVGSSHKNADFFAFAANESSALATVLKYRSGVLADKREHLFSDATDLKLVRNELLTHYYIADSDLPAEVFVDAEFEDRAVLAKMLSEHRGAKVTITVPKKGDMLAVVNMAYENASDSLKRRFSRATREQASLAELCNMLGLSSVPETIEAYDISNYGDDAVAGMVVYKDGKPKKSDYRRFKIQTVEGTDDYASMREVLSRRIARFDSGSAGSFGVMPDLILLDGGRGHVSAVHELIQNSSFRDVPLFGMVKDDKHRTRGIVGIAGEISVPLTSNAFRFVSSVQNEVHRFSLEYRRQSHSKSAVRSSLLDIPGVGEYYSRKLLQEFKTVANIKNASKEALQSVEGISKKTAENIYIHFHGVSQ